MNLLVKRSRKLWMEDNYKMLLKMKVTHLVNLREVLLLLLLKF